MLVHHLRAHSMYVFFSINCFLLGNLTLSHCLSTCICFFNKLLFIGKSNFVALLDHKSLQLRILKYLHMHIIFSNEKHQILDEVFFVQNL